MRERFRHGNDCCCDGGCSSGCCGGTGGAVGGPGPRPGEKIDPPKKLENPPKNGDGKDVKPGQVRIENQPFNNNIAPTVPSVEIAPVPAPRVEGDRRDPF